MASIGEQDKKTIQLFSEVQASPATARVYKSDLRGLATFLTSRACELLEARQSDLVAWTQALRVQELGGRRGLCDSTLSRKIRVARAFFDFYLKKGKVVENPAGDIKPPKVDQSHGRTPCSSKREVELLLGVMDTQTPIGLRDRTIAMLLYGHGIRLSEVATLEKRHFATEDGSLVIRRAGKGGRLLKRFLNPDTEKMLREHLKRNVPLGEYVFRAMARNASFHAKAGRDPRLRPISVRAIQENLKRHARRAGLDPGSIRPHGGRVFFVTEGYRRSGNLEAVSREVGHARLDTTRRYLRYLEDPKDSVSFKIKLIPREPFLSKPERARHGRKA